MTRPSKAFLFRTITTLRPQYFSPAFLTRNDYFDKTLDIEVTNVDIGAMFWERTFRHPDLVRALDLDPEPEPTKREFGVAAMGALDEARAILGKSSVRLPPAADLLFCYRVILECARIASLAQQGYKVHIAQGLVALECDQRDLQSILDVASRVDDSAIGKLFDRLLAGVQFPVTGTAVAVINLRNDGELYQVVALAAWLKARFPATVIVLDAAGGNEQYNFGEWIPVFRQHAGRLSPFLDYFLPRQDYHASLRALLRCLLNGGNPTGLDTTNIIALCATKNNPSPGAVPATMIEDAFEHYAGDPARLLRGRPPHDPDSAFTRQVPLGGLQILHDKQPAPHATRPFTSGCRRR